MNVFEYSPFDDAYVPYLVKPELSRAQLAERLWQELKTSGLPFLTRWIIYRSFNNWH